MSGLARVLLELLEVGAQEHIEESDKECDEHNACSAEEAPLKKLRISSWSLSLFVPCVL